MITNFHALTDYLNIKALMCFLLLVDVLAHLSLSKLSLEGLDFSGLHRDVG